MNKRKVQLTITGRSRYAFLHAIHMQNIRLTKVREQEQRIIAYIAYDDVKEMRRLRKKYSVKIKLKYATDDFLQPQLTVIVGVCLLILIPMLAQNYFWLMSVDAPTIEQQKKAEQHLRHLPLPLIKSNVDPIQQAADSLYIKMPDISWVHVQQKGSTLHFSLQPAPYIGEEKIETSNTYIASTTGVIDRYFIASGKLAVKRGETVNKGDVLVQDVERGVAKVFANYLLNVQFKLPATLRYSTTEGRKTLLLTDDHIDSHILPLVERKILRSKPADTTLELQKLLHVTYDNDTVKGEVLYLVNENIAIPSSNRARR
ncbi:MAG: sporulation protein YqfD [Lysinibacillus sp.]